MSYIRRGTGDYEPSLFNVEWPYNRNKGLGCGGDTSCGCGCDKGMGLFDSADPTTWGIGELATLGVGGYLAIKLFGDVSKGTRNVRRRAKTKPVSTGIGTVGLLALAGGAYYLWSKSTAGGGLGDYMPQSYVSPQLLVAPVQSAAIRIPAGW